MISINHVPVFAPDDRAAYCADLEARVNALARRIAELERREEAERLDRPGHEPGPEVRELQARHAELSRALARCQFIEHDDWISARAEAESASRRVEEAMETAAVRFRGRGTGGG